MSNLAKRIIEESLNKNPSAIKEIVAEALTEKAQAIIETVKPEFGNMLMNGDEDQLDLDLGEDQEAFFEEFHAEYGHLSEDEQLEMMEAFEAEFEQEAFFEEFHAEYGHLPEDEQLAIMEELEEELSLDEAATATHTHRDMGKVVVKKAEDGSLEAEQVGSMKNRRSFYKRKVDPKHLTPIE